MHKPGIEVIVAFALLYACDADKPPPAPAAIDPAAAASSALKQAEALASAASVPADADVCERAWVELKALVDGFEDLPNNRAKADLPQKAEFRRRCAAIPEQVRPCLQISHAMKHAERCKALIDALPPHLRDKARVLVDKNEPRPRWTHTSTPNGLMDQVGAIQAQAKS